MPRALTKPSSMPHIHVSALASPVRHQTQLMTHMESLPEGKGISVFRPWLRASPPVGGASSDTRHSLPMQEDSPAHH
jgi:hypothetical protein